MKEHQAHNEECTFYIYIDLSDCVRHRVQELRESQGGRPGFPVLMSLRVSVDVKQY